MRRIPPVRELKPPPMRAKSIDERIRLITKRPLHHSYADWDFSSVNWVLDEDIYHDAPPSLHSTASVTCLVKHATTGALSDGRLITWARSNNLLYGLLITVFRNQVADGGANFDDTYLITIQKDRIIFYSYEGGVVEEIDTKAFTWVWAINTWYKIRVTWWSALARIYVRVERWDGAAWVTLGGASDTDFEDTDDLWKDNPVNRCGIGLSGTYLWYDDVEVWA